MGTGRQKEREGLATCFLYSLPSSSFSSSPFVCSPSLSPPSPPLPPPALVLFPFLFYSPSIRRHSKNGFHHKTLGSKRKNPFARKRSISLLVGDFVSKIGESLTCATSSVLSCPPPALTLSLRLPSKVGREREWPRPSCHP